MMITAAGVLPYARDPKTNNVFFLLCRERYSPGWADSGKWSDFGGHRESPHETSLQIAAREFYEESLGILCDNLQATELLLQEETTHRNLVPLNSHQRIFEMFAVPIEYDENLPRIFKRVIQFLRFCHPNPEKWLEKTEIRWFSIQDVNRILYGTPDFDGTHNLRAGFAQSLYRMAQMVDFSGLAKIN